MEKKKVSFLSVLRKKVWLEDLVVFQPFSFHILLILYTPILYVTACTKTALSLFSLFFILFYQPFFLWGLEFFFFFVRVNNRSSFFSFVHCFIMEQKSWFLKWAAPTFKADDSRPNYQLRHPETCIGLFICLNYFLLIISLYVASSLNFSIKL